MSFQEFKDAAIDEYSEQTYPDFNSKYTHEDIDIFMCRSKGEAEVMRYFSDYCESDLESSSYSEPESLDGYTMNDW